MTRFRFSPLAALAGLSLLAAVGAAEPRKFTVRTLPGQMRYDVTEISVEPGAQVRLTFVNQDQMPHNMIFFAPGTDAVAVCNAQLEKPEEALKRNYLPEDPRMWMHSKLLNPEEQEELVFQAPEKPGSYPFVCSMPGHALIMQGRLKVFAPGPQLTDLQFHLYLGDWKTLPDFSMLTPHREGPVPDNKVQLSFDDYKNQYGLVFTGHLKTPVQGEYTFAMTCDDGGRVLVDGKKVVEYDGIHPATTIKEGKVKLSEGTHDFRLEYFQAAGNADIFVAWKGPDFAMTPLSKWLPKGWEGGAKAKKAGEETTGLPLTVGNEPVIYRNFIEGAGNRGIGVGYPGGINLAWSAESMNLAEVWRGAFMDAARHWHGRGSGFQPPMGYDVVHPSGGSAPPLAVLASPEAPWPRLSRWERAEGFAWRGYKLDAQHSPVFQYRWNGVEVAESYQVSGDAVKGTGKLTRTLILTGPVPKDAYLLVASGPLKATGEGWELTAPSPLQIVAPGAKLAGDSLLLPAGARMVVTYAWPATQK